MKAHLKKVMITCFSLIFLLILGAFILNRIDLKTSNIHPVTLESINMKIKEGTLTNSGATIIIQNLGKEKVVFGEHYIIEKEIWNYWKTLKNENGWTNLVGYSIDANSSSEIPIHWENKYGKLTSGKYRLMKDVNEMYIAVEFTID